MKDETLDVDQMESTQEEPTQDVVADSVSIGFGDETPDQTEESQDEGGEDENAPEFIATLRKEAREAKKLRKQIEELQRAAEDAAKPKAPPIEPLHDKPTLAAVDYDDGKYEAALIEWHEKKRVHDAKAQEAKAAQEAEANEYQAKVDAFKDGKAKLAVSDYDAAEKTVLDAIGQDRFAGLLGIAKSPVELVYALGKSKAKLDQLAGEKNPAKFVYAMAQMETQLKVTPKSKPSTTPEGRIVGTSGGGLSIEKQLEAARAKGDITEAVRLKKLMKQK